MNNDLRRRRGELGWSQAELARRLDVSRQTVNALETGRYDPSLPLAFALADVFRCTIEALFEPDERVPADRRAPRTTDQQPPTSDEDRIDAPA